MSVRALGGTDARAMADIHARSFERGWPELDMSVHIARDMCLGMGDPVRAFVIIRCAVDQADLLTIATHPDHLRRGLARLILSAAFDHLRGQGVRALHLEVAEDNAPAIAFYKSHGFDAVARRPAYYRRVNGRMAAITYSINIPPV